MVMYFGIEEIKSDKKATLDDYMAWVKRWGGITDKASLLRDLKIATTSSNVLVPHDASTLS
jgi:hypothetical protein